MGYIKCVLHLHCKYSLPHLLKFVLGAVVGVLVDVVGAWSWVSWRYIEAYDEGLVAYLQYRDPEDDEPLFHRRGAL